MMRICKNVIISIIISTGLFTACKTIETPTNSEAQIKALSNTEIHNVYNPYPSGATIPVNLCPINIAYPNRATTIITLIDSTGKTIATHKQYFSKTFHPSEKRWHKWLRQAYKGSITISHPTPKNSAILQEAIVHSYQIAEPIDPYISYRKTLYNEDHQNMFIEERDITGFKDRKLIISSTKEDSTNTCINCHNTKNNNGDYCLIHVRSSFGKEASEYSGTYLIKNNKVFRLNPQWDDTLRAFSKLVYYDYHPMEEKIIFSTNSLGQAENFLKHGVPDDYMTDTLGIIILYDIEKNKITTSSNLSEKIYEYAFPVWNTTGTEIYFFRGVKANKNKPWDYLFDFCKAKYESITNTFEEPEIIFPFSQCGVSATMPRQIPGTNKIIVTVHKSSGSIPLLTDGDYYILDLDEKQNAPFPIGINTLTPKTCTLPPNKYAKITELKEVNTLDAERWHNFSSNGRWMIFSSSRLVGEQSYPHIVYVDKNGNFGKPLAMPQKEALFFTKNTWSFIIPNASKTPASFQNKKAAKLFLEAEKI
jgi:hypothetical protein